MATDRRLEYLYASLSDLQSTIRAIDTKISYLLVVLFIPLTKLSTIYTTLKALLRHNTPCLPIMSGILTFGFIGVWIIGFWCALLTIIAIDDPRHHIDGERPESQFYPAHLFRHGFWAIIGFTDSSSMVQFSKHYCNIPGETEEIAKQLTLEQMKTMYIVSLKLRRSVFAYFAAIIWVVLGGTLWFLNLVFM